ncbi:transposase IS66 family protein (plasmid) [Burkholderia glumae LMG 2196 = ATCC 33617]|nr:transposase IS66 family protein [Burkholderia glumae LMG 2196 = ATCC 33617]
MFRLPVSRQQDKWSALQTRLACCDRIVQAAAPSRPIDRGIPDPALLAHIDVSKFSYHIPLHCQAVMHPSDGVEIEPGTMGFWMGSIASLLAPVDPVRRYGLAGSKVHGDDTPLPALAPGNGRTKTGRLWVYVRDATGRPLPKIRQQSGSPIRQIAAVNIPNSISLTSRACCMWSRSELGAT